MKTELWKLAVNRSDEMLEVTLPATCTAPEYVILPGMTEGSVMLMTPETFDAWRTAFEQKMQGNRITRFFLARAMLAEVEEGRVPITPMLAEAIKAEEEIWCVKEAEEAIYYLASDANLASLLGRLERQSKS